MAIVLTVVIGYSLFGAVQGTLKWTRDKDNKDILAEIEFSVLMLQVENGFIDIEKLSDSEYIELGRKAAELINRIGKVATDNEHYFRNYFSRAPQSLSDMIDTIKNNDSMFKWRLMLPGDTVFHMFGDDGEFNVKFLSEDGFFEAIYNKKGELLTKDNDPLNMGTFNYGSPITNKSNHTNFDVNTYFKWGNAVEDTRRFLKTDPTTDDHLEPKGFHENREAVECFNELYKSVYGEDYVELLE
ncbi:hypothetical protein FACS189490_13340 [Clostridia bacterium]|nr:hypothetical protein FACS189490_13340 [Clostridia bacterium]